MDGKSCCAPSGGSRDHKATPQVVGRSPDSGSKTGMVQLNGGFFLMGADGPETWRSDQEGPVREVEVKPFWIEQTTVTNDQFAAFVEATGYVTEAEQFGWSFVFHNQIPKQHRKNVQLVSVEGTAWWARLDRADWRKPGGPGTNLKKIGDHPVVHVSWNDASAYASWIGKRLPTESEWEFAARGGLVQKIYPWGDELMPDGKHRCNIWQGRFPQEDTGEDGYTGTAPAKSFRANGYGLYHCVGNVWEWTADWFAGSGTGRVIRGGSYLCHDSYCNRYRNSARTKNTPDSSTGHTGFRCAVSVAE
ncbi:MAG: formylglycine-generating enzyme family protein [Verrucomicrobiales bacterium]|nr:formylglycine-generating enzyme family protein [bacterium]MDF2375295.1 formylglycine-generating enzyme family protein [Verrucomicrobiales bacterium]